MRSFTLPLARTNSWEKVLSENDCSAATERSHQSMARSALPPSMRSHWTEESSPFHLPSTTALSPSQRARSIFSAIAGAEEEEALALAEVLAPGPGLLGAGFPLWDGESAPPTPASEKMRRLARYAPTNTKAGTATPTTIFCP